jgi:hypothetical protein
VVLSSRRAKLAGALGGRVVVAAGPGAPLAPAAGEWFTLLDVGQGLAAGAYADHTLVFDTGPRLGTFDTGAAVVEPICVRWECGAWIRDHCCGTPTHRRGRIGDAPPVRKY